MKNAFRIVRLVLVMVAAMSLSGCEAPAVYGSIGVSSYSGYGGGPRIGTSISMGGRIY